MRVTSRLIFDKVFLDLDDTLNRFTLPALCRVGCPIDPHDYGHFPHPGSYDIVAAANTLRAAPLTKSEFWDSLPREFWATLPKSDEFEFLLEFAERLVGREQVCILTSPTIDPLCLAGKLDWLHRNMPREYHRQFLIGPRKHFCAHPRHLLIDDSDANVESFRLHGGQAVLLPRPWNSLHSVPTMPFLANALATL